MEKEFIKELRHSVTLNVTAGKIDSYRELEKTSGTVRVYDKGLIGIAGCLGEPDEDALTVKAAEALGFGIPYPCSLGEALELEDLHEEEILPVSEFIPVMQSFLDRLTELCPKFAVSNKISLQYRKTEYRNSLGRHLVSSGRRLSVDLIAQNRGSGNLFDTGFFWSGTSFDPDLLLARFKKEYDAFYTPADLAPGRYPVIFDGSALLEPFLSHFTGDMYAAGASLLSGRMGEKIFSDRLTIKDDMNPATSYGACFFDAEGCIAPDYRPVLIENGVLKGLGTTKKTADKYGLQNIGTADAAYDGVPECAFHGVYTEPTADSLRELVPGKAVYIVVTAGGDTTPDGHFAAPVQMAYLMENGELAGRLPLLNIGGSFFDMLGKDYIGSVHDEPFAGSILCAAMMDVDKD